MGLWFALSPLGLLHGVSGFALPGHGKEVVPPKWDNPSHFHLWHGCGHLQSLLFQLVLVGIFL